MSNGLSTQPRAARPNAATSVTLEALGRSLKRMWECDRCLILARERTTGLAMKAAQVGFGPNTLPLEEIVTRIAALPELREDDVTELPAEDRVAIELLGRSRPRGAHALAGRIVGSADTDLLFLAGWRMFPLDPKEIGLAARAMRAMWQMAQELIRRPALGPAIDRSLEEFAFPAFAVDQRMRLLGTNQAGKQMLLAKEPVRLDHGTLVGASPAVSGLLRRALQDTIRSRFDNAWASMVVPLSTDHRAFAFAWVGAAPNERYRDRVLITIPQIDPSAGAKRIATAFGLSWAEERIVSEILLGRSPPKIGEDLSLTEATVRTYIKRIMLKVGINRQAEFYLLYILTLPPFVDRCRTFSYEPRSRRGHYGEVEPLHGGTVWNNRSLSA